MTTPWIAPAGAPVAALSPSAANTLLECPARLAFQRDDRTRDLRRPSTRTSLGTVAHRLTELVLEGAGPSSEGRREWLEGEWTAAISEQQDILRRAWPNRDVPPPERWAGYVAVRTRLLRRLASLDEVPQRSARQPAEEPSTSQGTPTLPWVERRLEDDALGLFGTPDLVEERGGKLRVVDLKSGVHQAEILPGQRRQLLLYAHLVETRLERTVDEVAVVDLRGAEKSLSVEATEVQAVVDEVLAAREQYNARNGMVAARPAEETCERCPFRVVCESYWQTRSEGWRRDVVAGRVTSVLEPKVAVVLRGDTVERLVLLEGEQVHEGDFVVASGVAPAGPETFRMRWDTIVHVVRPGVATHE